MDLYRVVALLLIVIGHWVAACLTFSDGGFWQNPLVDLPWTQWLTWFFQAVPVFFVVAGYANAASWSVGPSTGGDGVPSGWRRRRLGSGRTDYGYVAVVLAVVTVLGCVGIAARSWRSTAWAVALHLWFLPVYLPVVSLTPIAVAAHRRWGLRVPAASRSRWRRGRVTLGEHGAHLRYVAG